MNPFLDEIRSQLRVLAQLVIQRIFGLCFRGDVVSVAVTRNAPRFWLAARFLRNLATPVPTPLACGVGTVFELLDRLLEGSVGSVGYVEFDNGGTTVVHCISH